MPYLFVALGGALGSVLRYGLSRLLPAEPLPFGTLAANVLGSALLVVIMHQTRGLKLWGTDVSLLLGTGMMGGFTTYSTFNLETLQLLHAGAHARSAAYASVTLASCMLGAGLAHWLLRPAL